MIEIIVTLFNRIREEISNQCIKKKIKRGGKGKKENMRTL